MTVTIGRGALVTHGLDLLAAGQAPTGAYVASPNLGQYRNAWFRDGTFCAHAMALHGRTASAAAFHDWVARTLLRYEPRIQGAVRTAREGVRLPAQDCLHCRFGVDGAEVPGHWGTHQLDGPGTWLWALERFLALTGRGLVDDLRKAADLAADYLAALWPFPCSDWWEEGEDATHTSTLAAVAAGLAAHARMTGSDGSEHASVAVRARIDRRLVTNGRFVKSTSDDGVDASLVSLHVPYEIVTWEDSRYQATLARIDADLASPGLHRYLGDTFYGGGAWVLLTAWLGWAHASVGDTGRAAELLAWVEAQATGEGDLSEQVPERLLAPAELATWTARWGPVATPLLWSHAMHLILVDALSVGAKGGHP